jgi:hypothetical protein
MVDQGELSARERELLLALTHAWLADEPGVPFQPFVLSNQAPFAHPNWPDGVRAPQREEARRFNHMGLLESSQPGQGAWVMSLTGAGQELGQQLGAGPLCRAPFPPDLQWYDMVRVLEAVLDLCQRERIPGRGVRFGDVARALGCPGNDENLLRGALLLHDDDYLSVADDNPPEASLVVPRPRTLQLLRDWPSTEPELVVKRLDQALVTAIERTDDPDEKSKLQKLRASAAEVGKSVLAGAIVAAGKAVAHSPRRSAAAHQWTRLCSTVRGLDSASAAADASCSAGHGYWSRRRSVSRYRPRDTR